jgi:hypothetical protein
MSDLVANVEKSARKPWITQMINKMDERRSIGPITREMKKYYTVEEERNILHTIKTRLTGLVTSCAETGF